MNRRRWGPSSLCKGGGGEGGGREGGREGERERSGGMGEWMDGGRKGMEYGVCTCTRGSAQAITSGGRILKALLLHFCALYVLINSQNKWISVVGKIYLSSGQN